MASAFNLTAQINLRGPTNLRPIVSQIRKQLGSIDSNINLKIDNKAAKSIDGVTNRLGAMNKVLVDVRNNTVSLNQSLRDLSGSLGSIQSSGNSAASGVKRTAQSVEKVSKDIKVARTEMEEFGRQSALAVRRFAAFSVVTTGIFALTNAISSAFSAFIDFDRELIKLQQVTGRGAISVKILQEEITNLAVSLGVSSASLIEVASTLAQAGLNIEETRVALKALAKTELAPSFENLTKTTEGAIAAIRQFGLEASELEGALGSINAVAAAFAVESGDIIAAIQRTGGVFASASKGVSEGTDALNEFVAIFTSVRQTTRESAETIATGLRTIFTRIQRAGTIKQLREFGVELQDLEGKFVGPFEAIRRLSEALNQLDPRDIRFSTIVEELGGFRQIGKVIPLIQQFAVAQQALGVAQRGQSSLTAAQVKAQESLSNQIAKVREQFLALIRDIGQSTVFQGFFKIVLGLTSGLISLASAFKPILPILAVVGAIKGVSAIGQFATGFFGGLKKGGGAGGAGQNIGESISGAKEKQRAEATAKAADAIKLNTDALQTLTSAVQSLNSTIKSRGASTLSGGGKVLGFNRGGVVPGSGRGDKVAAMLEPGEVVMNNQAAQKYGRGNLVRMNKLAEGGKLFKSDKKYGMLVAKEDNPPDVDPGAVQFTDPKTNNSYTAGLRISGFKKTDTFNKYASGIDNAIDNLDSELAKSLPNKSKLNTSITAKAKRATVNAKGFMFENYVLTAAGLPDPQNKTFDITRSNKALKELTDDSVVGLTDIKLGNNPAQQARVIDKARRERPDDFKEVSQFMAGSPGGVKVPSGKGRGKTGARGSRSKFKELTQEEIFQLSTKDLIAYAKAQAYDIFTTGGAGIVTSSEFIEVPQERIVPELESDLTTYLGKRGFWREKISPFASEQKIKASVDRKMDPRTLRKMIATAGGVDSSSLENVPMDVLLKYAEQAPRAPKEVLEATIARYQKDAGTKGGFLKRFEQSAKSGEFISGKPLLDEIPDIPERLVAFRKSLEKELSETQDEKLRKSVLDKIVKTNNAIQEAKDYQKDILPTVTGRASHFAWAMRQAIPESKNFANGGLVQKFMAGSVSGVKAPVGKISQQILERIQQVGGSGYITANVSYDEIQKAVAEARAVMPKVGTAKQLLTLPSLKSLDNGSLLEEIIEPLLKKAEEKKEAEKAQQAGQKQLNEQAAAGKGLKFGLASLYGPNGELGYSNITSAKELLGKDGSTKYLTQLVRKSLPTRYADAVSKIQQDIAGLPARGAEQFQYTDIFGAIGPLAFDFDETLVKGADIFRPDGSVDIRGYSDLKKVKDALQNAQLTLLGKELAKRLIDYPKLMNNVRVLTARPQSNAPLLASKLSSLGLPIPESKITGVSGGLNKVDNLGELETLVDDNLENIQAVSGAGKLGYLYREPQNISSANQSSNRAIAAMEGYGLEEIVKQLGVGISSDDANPLRPIDYPSGLGYAANTWGFDPKMPTDTKRTNDSSAVSRLWAEAQKYITQNFADGGEANVKKQKSFGQIALRTGNRIQATYMKEGQAGQDRSGQVIADKIDSNLYAVQASAATKGYGPQLYDIVMEAATAAGAMLTSDRRTVSQAAKGVWAYYFNNRSDIKKTRLDPENWVSNNRLLDEKLYGPPETWPPANDPAWILQTGYNKTPNLINTPDVVRVDPIKKAIANNEPYLPDMLSVGGSASGNMVPAMVSNQEGFVPPKLAKRIGYAKLNRMNQADKNGMTGFAEGGISKFKGPGSGTSDSIGPIGLPKGSYVIRAKAMKAMNLNKGGSVGTPGFAEGGRLSKADRKRIKEQYLAEQRGGITRDEARFVGAPRPDFGAGASRKRDATATPQGVENIKKVEAEVLNNYAKLYSQEKKRIDQVYDNLESQAREDFFKGSIDGDELADNLQTLFEARILAKGQAKQTLTAQVPAAQTKAAEEFKAGKQTTQIEERKAESAKYFEATVQSKMDSVAAEVKKKYQDLLNQEVQSLKAFYTERAKQVKSEGGDVSAVIAEYRAAVADAKQSLEAGKRAATEQAQAAVPEQIATSKRQAVEQLRETRARAADPFYDAKQAAESSAAGMPGMPKVNPKIAQERQQYLQFKAEQSGMTVGGYKYSMAQKLGQSRFNVERETVLARTETRASATGRRRELEGINIKESLKADTQEGRRVQSIVDEFAANLQKADPSLGAGKAKDAAIALAEGLSDGTKSVEEIIAANETLKATLDGNIDSNKIMEEAFRRTALEMGESVENLKANVSSKQIEQQAFAQSTEGQRFGALAQFAPDLTQKISQTRAGKALGAGADFISGKGGRLSKAFAGAGGITGIGAGVAVGAETLKQLLPKSVTSDPNTAGVLGAVSGAGSGAAMGAQLGSFAGPIGTLIGGVGGAIIGGIQGFFNAKNQAILTNALEKTAKATGDLEEAFKKLESEATAENLGAAQEAFGKVLDAGTDIESLAFSKVGFENLGSTFSGGVDKVTSGLAEGDISKVVIGGLQTAFGATGGGLLVDYFSSPSEAQRTEATSAMIGGASQKNEAAARMASVSLGLKSTEELGAIFDSIKNGTNALNPITEQYVQGALKAAEAANGQKQLTASQTEAITVQAKERAALDAYMKKRKESGATDEQIAKEISTNRAAAQKEGEEAIRVQGELAAKQALLARATKEVAIATESLLDVYRRINAEAQRYSDELDQFSTDVMATVAGLGGDTSMREVNRQNEQVLGNVSAYSIEEVRTAANQTAGLLGGTPEAQNLANQAVGQKLVQDQIPALLRSAGKGATEQDTAIQQIKDLLASQGIEGPAINTITDSLATKLAEGQGLSESELQDEISKVFSTVGKGLEALQNVTKKYNDTLQQARKFQAEYNKSILEAGSYLRKATQVRLNAELDLAKALGRSPTLEELNKPFDVEVASLTGRLVESGDLAAGAVSDPMAIAAAVTSAERRKREIEQGQPGLLGAAANIPGGVAGDPLRQELNQAQLDNIRAVGDLTVASAEGRAALEKLANDGTKAANALAKIQEEQQALEGFANFAEKVFTAEPQQLADMELKATALNAAQAAGPEFMKSRYNRQQAFAGLEQEREFMTNDEYRQTRASLIRKSYESQINPATGQPVKGTDVVKKIAGKDITLDELEKRIAGGVDETDPNVLAFREASEVQAKANEALGKLNMEQAFIIQDAMLRLELFLSNQFPQIFSNAVTNAETDAQTKPEVKAEEKPSGPSVAEKNVTRGEEMVKSGKERLKAANAEFEALPWYERGQENVGRINMQINKAKEDIATGEALVQTNKPLAEKDKAARAAESSFAASRRSLEEAENKAKQTEENKAKAQEAIDKAKETREGGRPAMVRGAGQQVGMYTGGRTPEQRQAQAAQRQQEIVTQTYGANKPPLQAPPAPGTQQAAAQVVATSVDPMVEGIIKAKSVEPLGNIKRAESEKTNKESEIAKLEARARAERLAAKAAGTYEGPTKSETALATAQQDLTSINEQIAAEKQRLAAIAESAKLEAQTQAAAQAAGGTENPVSTTPSNPNQGRDYSLNGPVLTPQQQEALNRAGAIASEHNANMTELERRQQAGETLTPQERNSLSVHKEGQRISGQAAAAQAARDPGTPVTAPVPVTMPSQVSYTNQQATPTTAPNLEEQKAAVAQALTIDSASIEALNNFNTTFGSYVDKLVTFEFPTIPDVIEMKGNHVVDVRISGAAAFEGLKKDFEKMMQTEIKKAMGKIWGQSKGEMGERPEGTTSKP